ncbi:MAG: Stp1/IreP family PP2C-type Ser/Thr phosphatase [Bacteriovoracaceae bacterium]|jgi:PPM family protein phosphatase|nr:Stp1/IreP family PP2C-type Ser/Thr phosphatase [Bacteriovoracaceae bacterium]
MKINIAGLTDVGIKRDHNEDYFIVTPEINLAIICDGMGGHAAGEVASEMTATVVTQYLLQNKNILKEFSELINIENAGEVKSLIHDAVVKAGADVWDRSVSDESKRGMGTTLALVLIIENQAFMAHVGDSRVYLSRENKVLQITEDHSYVNEMVKQGLMSKKQAAKSPHANIITRAIGQQQFVKPDVMQTELMDGDQFIICSDGLSEYMLEKEFEKELQSNKDIRVNLKNFINFANKAGGKDNITAIIMNVGDVGSKEQIANISHKINALKKVPLFKNFTYNELNKLIEIIRVKIYATNEFILKEGTTGEDMFIILAGKVDIIVNETVQASLGPGKLFGEMSLIDKSPRSASIRSTEETRVMVISRTPLFSIFKQETRIAMKIFWSFLQNMNKRLRLNDEKVTQLVALQTKDNDTESEDGLIIDDLNEFLK